MPHGHLHAVQRLKRVPDIDSETGRACGGGVGWVACIDAPVVIEEIFA
jgi:hypothetical protein